MELCYYLEYQNLHHFELCYPSHHLSLHKCRTFQCHSPTAAILFCLDDKRLKTNSSIGLEKLQP